MKRQSKRVALAAIAAPCAVLLMGCETLVTSFDTPVAAEEAGYTTSRARVLGELQLPFVVIELDHRRIDQLQSQPQRTVMVDAGLGDDPCAIRQRHVRVPDR